MADEIRAGFDQVLADVLFAACADLAVTPQEAKALADLTLMLQSDAELFVAVSVSGAPGYKPQTSTWSRDRLANLLAVLVRTFREIPAR